MTAQNAIKTSTRRLDILLIDDEGGPPRQLALRVSVDAFSQRVVHCSVLVVLDGKEKRL